jgi:hypothetical protein
MTIKAYRRAAKALHRVPITIWDAAMRQVCGATWETCHEADILARAAA